MLWEGFGVEWLQFLDVPFAAWPPLVKLLFAAVAGILVLAAVLVASFPVRLWWRRRRQRRLEKHRRDPSEKASPLDDVLEESSRGEGPP